MPRDAKLDPPGSHTGAYCPVVPSAIQTARDVLGGEPVFEGTRIPLQHIASLFRKGAPEKEIAEDFPSLKPQDLAYARLAARFGRKPGRPKKHLDSLSVNYPGGHARRRAISKENSQYSIDCLSGKGYLRKRAAIASLSTNL